MNNCTTCGRIVCALEGPGPCFFCGNSVMPIRKKDETDLLSQEFEGKKSYKDALSRRDMLLRFQKQATPGNRIFDENMDFYEIMTTFG